MTIIEKWIKQFETIETTGRLDHPMIEPQVSIATKCVVAALLTIAEVIQERD